MPTSRLIAIEAALVVVAAFVILLIVANPFSSGGGDNERAAVRDRPSPTALGAVATPTRVPPTATPTPGPDPLRCGPTIDAQYMANTQIVSYYGNPYTAQMGILGELEPPALVSAVEAQAAEYDSLNGPRGARAAMHIVYGTAQEDPGREGLHLLYVDGETMQEYIDLACEKGMLVFIDLQVGRSSVAAEVEKALDYLEMPNVHLAIDPEFAMPPGEIPGESIGTVDAADVNAAQSIVEGLIEERGLADKIVMVHRFLDEMVTRPELIESYPHVRLVMDMDGFGPAEIKRVKYGWYAEPWDYKAIKLFFQHDPDLMTPSEVLELNPNVIIYQ